MKRLILIILPLILLTGCERRLNQALKSDKKDFILKVAEDYEQKKKYTQAISLYDYAAKFVVGTDEAPEIAYRTANLNYNDGNYRLAAHQFKNFVVSYPKDRRVEEASYMAAYCYYVNSPDYNLDQTNTYDALRELQLYIDGHPNSSKLADCNEMIDNLNKRLEKKAFENAKTLYKITEYKAAIVSFDNVLEDFPDTKLKEEILIYSLRSKTELAVNSIHRLQEGRINDAIKSYQAFTKSYPSSEYSDEVKRLKSRLDNARQLFKIKEKLLIEADEKSDKKNKDLIKERKKIS